MKKIIIVTISLLVVLGFIAGGYFIWFKTNSRVATQKPKDLTGIIVPPIEFSMKGKIFTVPNSSTTVALDLVAATAKRDYPMGRFSTLNGDTATLSAQDDFATPLVDNIQTVPIVVTDGPTIETYLALLEGEESVHTASLPIGGLIKITSVSRENDQVTVNYLVHDRGQDVLSEVPSVATAAIFDINTKQVVQKGRTPLTEAFVEVKSFKGEYLWKTTKYSDGKTVVPNTPDVYTMIFDANRVSFGTDCNTGSATFSAEAGSSTKFVLDTLALTKMFCEPGQEGDYFAMVQSVTDYNESESGNIIFNIKDGAIMTFSPKGQVLEFASSTEGV